MTMVFELKSGELVLKSNDSSDHPFSATAATPGATSGSMIDPEMVTSRNPSNDATAHHQQRPELQLQLQEVKFSS